MSKKKDCGNLLDYLAEELNCHCLSDLRTPEIDKKKMFAAVEELHSGVFSLQMWKDAVRYLFQKNDALSTEEEARAIFREMCQ